MKLPPNFGSITKLKGNRRRPYMVRITTGKVVNFETKKAYQKQTILGYFATKSEALKALAEYNANPYNLDRSKITIREIWEQIKDKIDVSEDRLKKYESNFKKYLAPIADKRIADVKAAALQDIFDSIQYGYSTQSITRSVLNHIYLYAVQNDIVQQNYVSYCKLDPAETRIKRDLYSAEEISAIWQESDRPEYAFTLILLYEGTRIKELRDMLKNAVDLTAGTLEIREGKNLQSRRVIPIHDKVRPIIEEAMKSKGDRLFEFSKTHYDYFVKQCLDHKPYDTRHTFASKANEKGLPKLIIQRIMGHKPDSVLEQSYIHLTIDELRNAINQIDF
ncbi:MAG: tyrosine-type recombinase/integrase [Clostridia bacterium]|nr:tyrosine-type recombinase/integrase [Clostridia bacterium]